YPPALGSARTSRKPHDSVPRGTLGAMTRTRRANRLADQTSPYLLQHAYNPVDWYPWGPEALSKARAEDKPILLSIGYAACHGCPAVTRVLEALAEAWRSDRSRVAEQGRRVVDAISRSSSAGESAELLSEGVLRGAFDGIRRSFDPKWGGFGGAPKFPQPMTL